MIGEQLEFVAILFLLFGGFSMIFGSCIFPFPSVLFFSFVDFLAAFILFYLLFLSKNS